MSGTAGGCCAGKEVQLPPSQPAIERVNSITALGVINDQLTATDHVSYILTACTSLLYALRVLRCLDIPDQSLKDVFQATYGTLHTSQNYLLLASMVWAPYTARDAIYKEFKKYFLEFFGYI